MMRKLLRQLNKVAGSMMSRYRKLKFNLLYQGITFQPGVFLDAGVRLKATDGARICLGKNVTVDRNTTIVVKNGDLYIGDHTYIGECSVIVAAKSIKIGNDCLVASHVVIRDQRHTCDINGDLIRKQPVISESIVIGNNVWLGTKSTVLMGSTIGSNSITGAHALIKGNIPKDVLAAGIPARIVKHLVNGERSS